MPHDKHENGTIKGKDQKYQKREFSYFEQKTSPAAGAIFFLDERMR
jgi:hypothetical protein